WCGEITSVFNSRGIPNGSHVPIGSLPIAGGTARGPYPGLFFSKRALPASVNGASSVPCVGPWPDHTLLKVWNRLVRFQCPDKSCGSKSRAACAHITRVDDAVITNSAAHRITASLSQRLAPRHRPAPLASPCH